MYRPQFNIPWDDRNLEPVGCVRSVVANALWVCELQAAHFDGAQWLFLAHDKNWYSVQGITNQFRWLHAEGYCSKERFQVAKAILNLVAATETYYVALDRGPTPTIVDPIYLGM